MPLREKSLNHRTGKYNQEPITCITLTLRNRQGDKAVAIEVLFIIRITKFGKLSR